jgi:6-pyruvoyltetrahydropterin/6-carboxytetrahydropterin synthase
MNVTVSRKGHFNAAHRLHNVNWSKEQNEITFGKCSNPYYHGHNYEVIVAVKGPINPMTGYTIDMKLLKEIIKQEVEEPFDHKNLNEQVEEFKNLNPTAENICVVIYNRIRARIESSLKLKITLYETPRNFVECEDE